MTHPYTPAEFDLASKLYAEHAGYDIANRLPPLRCRDPWHQRQWCAVARLATALVHGEDAHQPNVADLERLQVMRTGFAAQLPSTPHRDAVP